MGIIKNLKEEVRIIKELKQTARGRELAVVSVYLYLMRELPGWPGHL
jgi:hypothetical protein